MGAAVLLEPWYRFELDVPGECVGRALADLTRMGAEYEPPAMTGERATLSGRVPASEVQDYALDVAAYTSGLGRLYLELFGYAPCHDAECVIEQAAYEPEADLPNTPDSVFCSHGAATPSNGTMFPLRHMCASTLPPSAPGARRMPSSLAAKTGYVEWPARR